MSTELREALVNILQLLMKNANNNYQIYKINHKIKIKHLFHNFLTNRNCKLSNHPSNSNKISPHQSYNNSNSNSSNSNN